MSISRIGMCIKLRQCRNKSTHSEEWVDEVYFRCLLPPDGRTVIPDCSLSSDVLL